MRAQFPKYLLAVGLLTAAGFMIYCGGNPSVVQTSNPSTPSSTTNSAPATMGSVVVFGQDAPVCDVVSFMVTITAASLTPQNGGAPVPVLLSAHPVTVDFASLMDFSTILNFASVPAGTYSSITLALTNPQLMVLNAATPAPTTIQAYLATLALTVPIQPALQVTGNSAAGLQIDFNLLKSVLTNSSGQVTGAVTPVFEVSPSPSITALGELDDLAGLVQSVTVGSTPSTGSFTLLTTDGSTLTVQTTSASEFDFEQGGGSGLGQLATGTFVEVDALVGASGTIVAQTVDAEAQEDANQHRSAFVGLITSVTRDISGAATQFKLFVRDELPDESAVVPLKTVFTFNITDSTKFGLTAKLANEAGLQFDASTLGAGQEVVVHAQVTPGANPQGVTATGVFLRLRSLLGNFSALLTHTSAASGGFSFTPCAALFQGQSVTVVTFDDTAFAGVSGLTSLSAAPTLLVKGLLFYQSQPSMVNGVEIKAPGWVLEAKQVHQLSP